MVMNQLNCKVLFKWFTSDLFVLLFTDDLRDMNLSLSFVLLFQDGLQVNNFILLLKEDEHNLNLLEVMLEQRNSFH